MVVDCLGWFVCRSGQSLFTQSQARFHLTSLRAVRPLELERQGFEPYICLWIVGLFALVATERWSSLAPIAGIVKIIADLFLWMCCTRDCRGTPDSARGIFA